MDSANRKILALLLTNGRMSATAIGKEIGLSRTAVQSRMKSLENGGVIEGYKAIVNPKAHSVIKAIIMVTYKKRPCEPVLKWFASLKGLLK